MLEQKDDASSLFLNFIFFSLDLSSVQFLANGAINVNRMDDDKRTPLHILLSVGSPLDSEDIPERIKILKMLLAAGADPSLQDRNGWAPLHFAAQFAPLPLLIAFLRESGCEVNERNLDGTSALHYLSRRTVSEEEDWGEYANVVKEMLLRGADVNAQTNTGSPFSLWAECDREFCHCFLFEINGVRFLESKNSLRE